MKVHSEPRKRIKIGQSAERRGEYYNVWVMTFINEGGHYEESLPDTNLPF